MTTFEEDEDFVRVTEGRLEAITEISKNIENAYEASLKYAKLRGVDYEEICGIIEKLDNRMGDLVGFANSHVWDSEGRVFDYKRAEMLGIDVERVTRARKWDRGGAPVRELYFNSSGPFEYPQQLQHATQGCIRRHLSDLGIDYKKVTAVSLNLRKRTKSAFGNGGTVLLGCMVDYGNGKWESIPDIRVSAPTWGFWESDE